LKNSVKSRKIKIPENLIVPEILIFDLLSKTVKTRCILFYRAPDYDIHHMEKICEIIEWGSDVRYPVIILSDINFYSLDWLNVLAPKNAIHETFLTCMSFLGLEQKVMHPTLGDNILDIIFSGPIVDHVRVSEPFSTSDHKTVHFNIEFEKPPITMTSKLNFRRAQYDNIKLYLSYYSWPDVFSDCVHIDDFFTKFISILNASIQNFVPKYIVSDKSSKYPRFIRKMMSKKLALWRKYKEKKTEEDKTAYKNYVRLFRCELLKFQSNCEAKLLKSSNSKTFYNYVNSHLKDRRNIPDLCENNQVLASIDIE
jgi:hypothetical protein